MNEINRILILFDELQYGDCWIGNNFKEVLNNINSENASKKIMPGSNSAWQLVVHINFWRSTVVNRLKGSAEPPSFPDFVLPSPENEENWQRTLRDFETTYQLLRSTVSGMKAESLDLPSPKKEQSFYQLVMGCLQHDAYHLGQIALIKKNMH